MGTSQQTPEQIAFQIVDNYKDNFRVKELRELLTGDIADAIRREREEAERSSCPFCRAFKDPIAVTDTFPD